MEEPEKYYVYIYLDPRYKQDYSYKEIKTHYRPFYVGKGTGNRYLEHLWESETTTKNSFKNNKIRKIRRLGLEPIIIKVLEHVAEFVAYDLETALIIHWGRIKLDPGGILTNRSIGATPGTLPRTEEWINKTRKKLLGRKLTPDHIAKIKQGKANMSDEKKQEISEITSKRMKGTQYHLGFTHSEKTKQNLSEMNLGKKHDESTKQKMSDSHAEFLFELKDDKGSIYYTVVLNKFAKDHNLDCSNLVRVSKGKQKAHKGWTCIKLGRIEEFNLSQYKIE